MNTRHGLAHQPGLQREFISAKPNQTKTQNNKTKQTKLSKKKKKFGFELAGLESSLPTALTTLSGALCQKSTLPYVVLVMVSYTAAVADTRAMCNSS